MRSTYHYGSSTSSLCVRRTVDASGQSNGDTGETFDLGVEVGKAVGLNSLETRGANLA